MFYRILPMIAVVVFLGARLTVALADEIWFGAGTWATVAAWLAAAALGLYVMPSRGLAPPFAR